MSYYHYTKGCHLPSIVREGKIRTSNAGIEKREKPAAWLTKSPEWDSACNFGIAVDIFNLQGGHIYSIDELDLLTATNNYMKREIGMCRIIISDKLPTITWAKFKYVSGISKDTFNAIDSHSRKKGSPVHLWYCTFSPIPCEYWEGIEILVDNEWVKWDGKIPVEEFVELCQSCNGKKQAPKETINGFPKEHCQKQLDFIRRHHDEIIQLWKANENKKGYIEIYITPDYKPYPCGFQFKEKRVKKSTFKPLLNSGEEDYALVHFLWEATYTQYRMGINYENVY